LESEAASLEYLGEPGPENDHVAILADAFGNGKSVEEVGRHDLGKLHRIGGNGGVSEIAAFGGGYCRESAPGIW
jgi:hypothetical protein